MGGAPVHVDEWGGSGPPPDTGWVVQGVFCGQQPYQVLSLCLLGIGVCCLGLLRFQVETNPQRLWVGAGSLAAKEKARYEV